MQSLKCCTGLQKHHLLRPHLHLTFVLQPYILVPICESLPVYFYHILLAQTSNLPSLHLEIEQHQSMLSRYRSVRQLQIHFASPRFLIDIGSLFISADEENSTCNIFFPTITPQNSIAHLRKITQMHRYRPILILFLQFLLSLLAFPTYNLLLPFYQFQHLPAYLFSIFIITFQIRTYICYHLCCLIFFY